MLCNLCPRMCNVDRSTQMGFCGVSKISYVARVGLHMWEEPFISGKNGSGTIFFCGCNLRCLFCQNHDISTCGHMKKAVPVNADKLSAFMLELESQRANNINFVTPTPHIPLIAESIIKARKNGLSIPIAFNTNSYINVSSLKILDGLIDIYMPDFKYVTPELSKLVSCAEDYPTAAKAAISEMYRQCGSLNFDDSGIAKKGVLIRHLVLPGNIDETRRVLDTIAHEYPMDIHISLMAQYFPSYKGKDTPPFDRPLLKREYKRAVEYAYSLGFTNILTQELSSANEEFVPDWGELPNI